MDRDARLLRQFQASVAVGGAMGVFALLDIALAATGIYPWNGIGQALAWLGVAGIVAVIALANARRVWQQRTERTLGGITFADFVMVVGFMIVGGVLLLGLFR